MFSGMHRGSAQVTIATLDLMEVDAQCVLTDQHPRHLRRLELRQEGKGLEVDEGSPVMT